MTVRTLTLAAAFLATLGTASATEIHSGVGGRIDLGALGGVAYYTPEPKGYHVVVTVAPRGAAPALRFETVLAAEQSVTLSTPRMPGEPATSVEIARTGDRVVVSQAGTIALGQEADATH